MTSKNSSYQFYDLVALISNKCINLDRPRKFMQRNCLPNKDSNIVITPHAFKRFKIVFYRNIEYG